MTALPDERTHAGGGSSPDATRWAEVETLLHEALERGAEEREQFLRERCSDSGVRAEVEALLQAHTSRGALDVLSDAVIAPLLPAAPPPPPPSATPPAPERYQILERVGGGGMGVVYRARDERLEREVALKFLPAHLSADAAAKKRFLVEARAAASLDHPNICTVHEIGELPDGQLYIVMGYYPGETLDRRISRGALPINDAVRIAAEVARGLGKAHDRRIVHRDIKPANIMLTADGLVKVLDFGIAKLSDHSFTQTGSVIGTIAYMSPEQAFGEVVDMRSDIWSLGVVLYEMLAGERPFRGPGEQALLFALLTQEPEPITGVRSDAPAELDMIVRRALAKAPADRFATVHQMLAALHTLPVRNADAPPAVSPDRTPTPAAGESALTRAGERRQAAIVSTAIADYGALVERIDPEELDQLTGAVRDAAVEIATRYGGLVNHFAGDDAVMLFGVAVAHEDDALRAVRATLALHSRVKVLGERMALRMRSGVHTGSVVAQRQRSGDRRYRITGSPTDVAARLGEAARADEILVSSDCLRLVAPFVEVTPGSTISVPGEAGSIGSHLLTGESTVQSRLELAERVGMTPYAGRSRELGMLQEHLASALSGEGRAVVIVGEAGSGKSRLLLELRRRLGDLDARLVLGRCDPYASTTAYVPFVQAVQQLLGLESSDTTQPSQQDIIAAVTELDPSLGEFVPLYLAMLSVSSSEHSVPRHLQGEHLQAAMLEALVALFTHHTCDRPLVLLLEDWQWADEASRAALERLTETAPAYPLLVVVTSRAEVEWKLDENRSILSLGPLSADASLEIMRTIFSAEEVAPHLAQQLHERTGGNPFFLEEACQALLEEGTVVLRRNRAEAAGDSGAVQFPETVQAVIRTRIDRLDAEARDTLRFASVIGRDFARAVLETVADSPPYLRRALERLRAAGLIQQTSVVPEPNYRFKHVLTQEVAYDTLLEHQRRTLHGAAARAVEQRYGDRLDEHLERLAHHFSRAEEWAQAVHYGIRAADRAKTLSHFSDALATLDQVHGWVLKHSDDVARRNLLADVMLRQERLCETLGMRARQLTLVDDLITLLAPHGGSGRLAEAYLRQGDVFTLLRRFDAADRALNTALVLTRELGDRPGERNAHRSIGLLRSHEGRLPDAITSIERALSLDLDLGERTAAAGDVASLGNVLRHMGRHEEALEVLRQALDYVTPDQEPTKWCAVMTVIAAVHRDLGRADEALEYMQQAKQMAVERRLPILASFSLPTIAHIQLEQGRVEESLATYRESIELSRRARHGDGLAQALRAAGEVLFGLGRCAEALPHLLEAADLFAQLEDRATETALWHRIATAQERCGKFSDAEASWRLVRQRCEEAEDAVAETAALEGIARCARRRGVRSEALEQYEQALAKTIAAGEQEREVTLRNTLGLLRWEDGQFDEALHHYEAALRVCRELEDRIHEGLILNSIGATLLRLRRYDEARTTLEEAVRINRLNGERQLEAHSEAVLGQVLLALGRASEARVTIERSLAMRPALGDRRGEAWMYEHLARALFAEGRHRDAAVASEAARTIAGELHDAELDRALERLRELLQSPLPTDRGA